MLKSLMWQEGLVLSIKVEEGLYLIAQMRSNHLLEVFNIFESDDDWAGVDLNDVDVLFAIFVFIKNIKKIFSRVVSTDAVVPNVRPVEKRMLSAIFGTPGNTGAKLIELTDGCSNIGAKVINENLSPDRNLDLIYRYELCGMVGDPEKIVARIKTYRETGINWDSSKEFLFPGIQQPLS
ncbi:MULTISPECIES: hypothetical protein [Pseudomonas]|uniref:hypothetical protein n=1 Tax=Pseudomonas TaxID=286 RepID=UPI0021889347|nr:hypothetical protein [Pseudomonas sp. LRP2-20]BDM22769.1 hypothetical protein KMS_R25260 [Pseudomonas sp. LRP2-20]